MKKGDKSDRRDFLKTMGVMGIGAAAGSLLAGSAVEALTKSGINPPLRETEAVVLQPGVEKFRSALGQLRSRNAKAAFDGLGASIEDRMALIMAAGLQKNPGMKNVGEAIGAFTEAMSKLSPEQRGPLVAGGFGCGSGCGNNCRPNEAANGMGCGSGCGSGCKLNQAANGAGCGSGCGGNCATQFGAIGVSCGMGCSGFPSGHLLVVDVAGAQFKLAMGSNTFRGLDATRLGSSTRLAVQAI